MFFLLRGVWVQVQLPAGADIYYYDIHISFPRRLFLHDRRWGGATSATSRCYKHTMINLSTEFYKDKTSPTILYSHPEYLPIHKNRPQYRLLHADWRLSSFLINCTVSLSPAERVSLGLCGWYIFYR